MFAEKVTIYGNAGEMMKIDISMNPILAVFGDWVRQRVVAQHGEVPVFTVSYDSDLELQLAEIVWADQRIKLFDDNWLVLFDDGGWEVLTDSQIEVSSNIVFQTNQGRPFEKSVITNESNETPKNYGFSFSAALIHLKDGNRVQRTGWNGKDMWLILVDNSGHYAKVGYELTDDTYDPSLSQQSQLGDLKHLPWIGMRTTDVGFVPWTASQTDLLADDWQVLD